ncbi:receptor like protein 27-like [Vitis vinifera]|uniref:receptor like protein 27-like n=1 Tax=Vitis vinifera TaxID=29760 RepID=UPI00288357D5|nr:receptor like protein 27-like [Vitis vinifera]
MVEAYCRDEDVKEYVKAWAEEERSQGYIFSVGFGKEELEWLLEQLKKDVELEVAKGFIGKTKGKTRTHLLEICFNNRRRFLKITKFVTKWKPSTLVVLEGVKGSGWEALRKVGKGIHKGCWSNADVVVEKEPRNGALLPVGKWAKVIICESQGRVHDWVYVGKVIARMMGMKGMVESRMVPRSGEDDSERMVYSSEEMLSHILKNLGKVKDVFQDSLKLVELSKGINLPVPEIFEAFTVETKGDEGLSCCNLSNMLLYSNPMELIFATQDVPNLKFPSDESSLLVGVPISEVVADSSSFMQQPLCHDSESSALLQFKQSFLIDGHASGDPSAYPKVAMWKSHGEGEGSDCCSWDGVECDRETGHVIGLHLASSCLYGSINSSNTLFSLVHLRRLDLSDNDFNYSEIPFSVGKPNVAASKALLEKSGSELCPLKETSSKRGNQSVKRVASLWYEFFCVGTLAWLGEQTKLTALHLRQINLIGEIPFSLVNMSQLTTLTLAENQVSGQIPSWLMNLTQLTVLELGTNNLEGGIPSSLFELVNLQSLSVGGNSLSGTVELNMLLKLKNLTSFQLSGNSLSLLGYTRTNVTLPKFKLLGLDSCNLTEFPDFLRNQDELVVLSLANNKIHGLILKWIWNISQENLGTLDLSGNLLTDFDQHPVVLPWSRLSILMLDSNMLQGPLPIPPPSTIEYYSVSRNKLIGEISPLICNVSSLMLLDLSSNNLSGRIPQCLDNLSKSLSVLDLGSNSLDGPFPQTCTVTNNLRVVDLGENQFQGQIPRSFANCMMLEHLVLGNNQIDDIFPFWLGALPQLQVLILRSNRFHGAIGSWHSNFRFPKLCIVDLSDNKFIGDLPSEYFQNWDAMKLTDIANDLRYMQAHPEFENLGYTWTGHYLYSLTMINRGMQRFFEKIPDILIAIDFSGNNFKGQIPTSTGNLKGLHLLNLGDNNLTGHIPSSLGNLPQLESLDLSPN